jgi:hypothetical protein
MAMGEVSVTTIRGVLGPQLRLSVRLNCERASLLKRLSSEAGIVPSDLIRRSLDHYAASKSAIPPAPKRPEIGAATAAFRQLPTANGGSRKVASPATFV